MQFFIIRNINKFHKFKKNKIVRGRPLKKSYSYILNAIFKILYTGMQWHYLSLENISYKTVNKYFNLWSNNNIFYKSYYQ